MGGAGDAGPYRFDELGWAQFECVCDELLAASGMAPVAWSGRADGVRLALTDEAPAVLAGKAGGPALVVVTWTSGRVSERADVSRPGSQPPATLAARRVAERVSGRAPGVPVVLMTNAVEVAPAARGLIETAAHAPVTVVGAARLSELVDLHPFLRRRVPSLLGVRDLSRLIDQETRSRSSWDEEAARDLARVFVPTRAYRRLLAVLEHHHFAVATGPPEMGKTAAARVLGLALQTEGWAVHECIRPDQVDRAFAPDRRQLFVSDDAFGSTEYRPDAADRWALDLDGLLRRLDADHWLVWTSRPAPLRASLARIHREHGVERFPRPAEVQVDAAALDLEEKATILYRHARAARLPRRAVLVVRVHGVQVVEHPHFTPERIKRFVTTRLVEVARSTEPFLPGQLERAIETEIASPTEAMTASFRALSDAHRAVLVALVDTPPGPVAERELAATARRHAPAGLPRPPSELVDRLTDHFVRIVPPDRITWVHPSWRDLVIEQLAADAELGRRFLERCSVEGALLAVSRGGGAAGTRQHPLLRSDGDWDALTQRLHDLVPELDDSELVRLLTALGDAVEHERETDPAAAELEAMADAVLRRIAACWSSGQSYASESLLAVWEALAARLRDPPPPPQVSRIWTLPPATRAPIEIPDSGLLAVGHRPGTSDDRSRLEPSDWIVSRILADLDPA